MGRGRPKTLSVRIGSETYHLGFPLEEDRLPEEEADVFAHSFVVPCVLLELRSVDLRWKNVQGFELVRVLPESRFRGISRAYLNFWIAASITAARKSSIRATLSPAGVIFSKSAREKRCSTVSFRSFSRFWNLCGFRCKFVLQ